MAYDNRGHAWYAKGEYDKAIADYDEAIRLDPKYAMAYNNRGLAWYAKQEYDKAIADYDKAIDLDPKKPWRTTTAATPGTPSRSTTRRSPTTTRRSTSTPRTPGVQQPRPRLVRQEEYDKAIADYDQAIRLDPKYAMAYNNRGHAWYAKEEYDKAIADYDKAIELDPKKPWPTTTAASPGTPRRSTTRRSPTTTRRSASTPSTPGVQQPRRRLVRQAGVRQGDRRLRPGHPPRPQERRAYNNRGVAWYAKQEYDKAIADYDKAIELDPKNAWPTTTAATPGTPSRSTTRRSPTTTRRSDSTPSTPWPTTTAATPGTPSRRTTRRSPTTTRRSASTPRIAKAYNSRAWLWATCPDEKYRDGKRAVESATLACELTDWKEAYYLDTLAAAYAECGDFAHAIEYQEKAQGLYKDEKDREKGRDRLALYREKKPYRDVPEAK